MRRLAERVRGKLIREWRNLAYHFWRLARGPGQVISAPILMIGCDRSGTTIAARLFCQHPDVTNFVATTKLWDPRHGWDRQADHHWQAERLTERDADRIRSRFEYERRAAGAKRVCEKNNRNSVRLEYLQRVFPDAYFIHIIRDGRAVVESICRRMQSDRHRRGVPMGWFTKPPGWREMLRDDPAEQAALQWRGVVEFILGHAAALGERYTECRYEDLCADCRGMLGSLYRSCGLRVDEGILSALPERLEPQNDKWRTRLTPTQIRRVCEIEGPLLRRLGYEVDGTSDVGKHDAATASARGDHGYMTVE